MENHAEAKRAFYRECSLGVVAVVALVIAVRFALPDFPSTSPSSMAFFAALAVAAVANLIAALARLFMKVPARVPVTWWMARLVISRVSFAWAMFLLIAVAVLGSIVDRRLSGSLFHTLIVEMMLGAFWFMATSTVVIASLLWSRFR
jgi:hypothetical protein